MKGVYSTPLCLASSLESGNQFSAHSIECNPDPYSASPSRPSEAVHISCGIKTTAATHASLLLRIAAATEAERGSSACDAWSPTPTPVKVIVNAAEQGQATSCASLIPSASAPAPASKMSSLLACSVGSQRYLQASNSPNLHPFMQGPEDTEASDFVTHMSRQGSCVARMQSYTSSGSLMTQQTSVSDVSDSSSTMSSAEKPTALVLIVHRRKLSTIRGFLLPFVWHSTVKFLGDQYSFGPQGFFVGDPLEDGWEVYREIPIESTLSERPPENTQLREWMWKKFDVGTYNALGLNCNDFCREYCWLLTREPFPWWVNLPAELVRHLLCLNFFRKLPYLLTRRPLPEGLTDRPLKPIAELQQPQAPALITAAGSSAAVSIHTLPTMVLACKPPVFSTQKSPASLVLRSQSIPVLSSMLTAPAFEIQHQITSISEDLDVFLSHDPPSPCSQLTASESAAPSQQPMSQPDTLVDATPTPNPQPSASSAPPPLEPNKWHRPECLKCVVPKGLAQKFVSFFCCGRAGVKKCVA